VKIVDFVSVHTVIPALTKREKASVLEELAAGLVAKHQHLDHQKVLAVLQERERISSTAIRQLPDSVRPHIAERGTTITSAGLQFFCLMVPSKPSS